MTMSSDDSVAPRSPKLTDRSRTHSLGVPNGASQQQSQSPSLLTELLDSSELLFQTKLAWLLICGPIALFGNATNSLGEAICFSLSGIALIPCAERLSFVTEQVAEHTNGTVGALLNATFGNAPELLIATAALRSGYYRVVQLAMLGSMLTNLLFVFGAACLIGGLRWQVQELRITSGNVSVGMLLVSTAASLLPAALIESGQLLRRGEEELKHVSADGIPIPPSTAELQFSRINAFVLMSLYICYLIFQLGTHKDEFDDREQVPADGQSRNSARKSRRSRHAGRRNRLCMPLFRYFESNQQIPVIASAIPATTKKMTPNMKSQGQIELMSRRQFYQKNKRRNSDRNIGEMWDAAEQGSDEWSEDGGNAAFSDYSSAHEADSLVAQDVLANGSALHKGGSILRSNNGERRRSPRRKRNRDNHRLELEAPSASAIVASVSLSHDVDEGPQLSLRVGIIWLLIITLCVSALSDMLVDTIDGFALRMKISQVFTSMVIVPFFSNVAEQVSAILFAFRNEMDLCVGVTVGSAIQVAAFVLPGSVLIGMFVDRSMSLYFHAYETVCLFLGVITVAAILQGGTTNWMVGAMLVGIYTMIASGFWFHELEDLSVDAESIFQNTTTT